jgi:hypothetical protein
MYVCVHTYIYAYRSVCVCVRARPGSKLSVNVSCVCVLCTYILVSSYLHMANSAPLEVIIDMYVYMYTHTHTHTHIYIYMISNRQTGLLLSSHGSASHTDTYLNVLVQFVSTLSLSRYTSDLLCASKVKAAMERDNADATHTRSLLLETTAPTGPASPLIFCVLPGRRIAGTKSLIWYMPRTTNCLSPGSVRWLADCAGPNGSICPPDVSVGRVEESTT